MGEVEMNEDSPLTEKALDVLSKIAGGCALNALDVGVASEMMKLGLLIQTGNISWRVSTRGKRAIREWLN